MELFIKKYLWALTLFGIACCAYFLASIVNVFVRDQLMVERKLSLEAVIPSSPSSNSKVVTSLDSYKIILDRNMFDGRDVETAPVTETMTETGSLDGPAVKTNLPVKLLSTFAVGDGMDHRSSATLQGSSGGPEVYSVGDAKSFSPGVKLRKILPDRVEFTNGNRLEYVEIENVTSVRSTSSSNAPIKTDENPLKSKVGGETPSGKTVIERAEVDNAIANIDKLFTEVRAVPYFADGKAAGLRLLALTQGNLLSKVGLQRGDILQRVNGTEIDLKRGVEIFNQLKNEKRITLDIERNGQKQTLDYEIR